MCSVKSGVVKSLVHTHIHRESDCGLRVEHLCVQTGNSDHVVVVFL